MSLLVHLNNQIQIRCRKIKILKNNLVLHSQLLLKQKLEMREGGLE